MNIEAENLDSLRKLVRELQVENTVLKEKLKKANIAYPESNVFEEKIEDTSEYDPDQGERIIGKYITEEMANQYFSMFWGRTDVYAKRGRNGGYFPQCDNRWNGRVCPKQCGEKIRCEDCENTKWTKKDVVVYDYIDSHLRVFENMYSKRLRTYKRLGYSLISNMILEKQSANAIYDSGNYSDVFEQDLVEAEKRIIISSPDITQDKIDRMIYVTKQRIESGCKITIITINPEGTHYGSSAHYYEMIKQMENAGMQVVVKDEVDEHFAIMDDELVWHGGMNLLGKEDVWDNLMRIKSTSVAEELLELSLGNNGIL